jgi:hypothetical protein
MVALKKSPWRMDIFWNQACFQHFGWKGKKIEHTTYTRPLQSPAFFLFLLTPFSPFPCPPSRRQGKDRRAGSRRRLLPTPSRLPSTLSGELSLTTPYIFRPPSAEREIGIPLQSSSSCRPLDGRGVEIHPARIDLISPIPGKKSLAWFDIGVWRAGSVVKMPIKSKISNGMFSPISVVCLLRICLLCVFLGGVAGRSLFFRK